MTSLFKHAVWISALIGTSFILPEEKAVKPLKLQFPALSGGLENIIVETYY